MSLIMHNLAVEKFISQLYKEAPHIPVSEFRNWSLEMLRQVIPFDAAIWGTGHISTKTFHTKTSVDISTEIFDQLLKYVDINPIYEKLTAHQGRAIDMSDAMTDEDFYQSTLYQACFKPYAIERILSSIHLDERSGIFTLLTLYRFDREQTFSSEEQQIQNRLLYHLLSSASHRQLLELSNHQNNIKPECRTALCDAKGIYHAVTQRFLDMIELNLCEAPSNSFPFNFLEEERHFSKENLLFEVQQYNDLYKISVRSKNQLDQLTKREQQVIEHISQGKTFKEVAKALSLSPSTVSNHLYRIYLKLGINTRSELINMMNNF